MFRYRETSPVNMMFGINRTISKLNKDHTHKNWMIGLKIIFLLIGLVILMILVINLQQDPTALDSENMKNTLLS